MRKFLKYKIFIRYALTGLVIEIKEFETAKDFYAYIGKMVLNSIEHIERIDYKII